MRPATRWVGVPGMVIAALLFLLSLLQSQFKITSFPAFEPSLMSLTLQLAVYIGLTGLLFWRRNIAGILTIGALIVLFLILSLTVGPDSDTFSKQHTGALVHWLACWAVAAWIQWVAPAISPSN